MYFLTVCTINLGSYGYTSDQVTYYWKKEPEAVRMSLPSEVLPQFRVKGHRINNNSTATITGDYTVLTFDIYFARAFKYYATQVYLPSTLVVIMAYFALWISTSSTGMHGARFGLGTCPFLFDI